MTLASRIVETDNKKKGERLEVTQTTNLDNKDSETARMVRYWEQSDRNWIATTTMRMHGAEAEMVRTGFKQRPIRDGGGKTSPGRLAPNNRSVSNVVEKGIAIIAAVQAQMPTLQYNLITKPEEHPFPEDLLEQIRWVLDPKGKLHGIEEGQPFHLRILKQLLWEAGDKDYGFMDDLAYGLPIGVDEKVLRTPGIWPTKEELKGMEAEPIDAYHEEEIVACDNYPSAEEHLVSIRETYVQEASMDMVIGPLNRTEAAWHCGCSEEE